ncbi:DMT family transporter [Pedobacter montanisoli]|uniref:DMT family transporter n=1 Tax=Pedobacter montanisoli TaxID=2923277 RepID=A0ABS9ZTR9_9SPHI|nr:DMT family transporter [Pedobacter montanisoli]MCJ0741976.1 DMT family transporter [Pedobacter montanisoli]
MKRSYIELHIAVLLAGFTGIFGRLVTLNAVLISWYRMMLAGIILVLLALLSKQKFNISLKKQIQIGAVGAVLAIHWVFFYGSIKYANISVGVVCFALSSFFTAVLDPLLSKRRIAIQEVLLSGISVLGIGLIFGLDSTYRLGIFLGMISSLFSAVYTILNKKLAEQYTGKTIQLYQMTWGFLGFSLLMPLFAFIFKVDRYLPTLKDLFWLLILVVFCTILMYVFILNALKKISAFTVSLSFNLEPLYTIFLAIIIYHENHELSLAFYAGLLLIVLSVALQMLRVWRLQLKSTGN